MNFFLIYFVLLYHLMLNDYLMKRLLFLLLGVGCWVLVNAHPTPNTQHPTLHIRHFGESDGFSTTIVQHAIQDSLGYIWLATWDGLRRYDGYRFRTYKTQPGDNCPLETNRISYIEEDAQHNIVCWSNDKFYLFNRKTERFEPYPGRHTINAYKAKEETRRMIRGLPDYENIETNILMEDRQHGIWIYTHRGLERIAPGNRVVSAEKRLNADEEVVSALLTDRQGRLWMADKQGYVSVSDQNGRVSWLDSDGRLQQQQVRFGYAAYHLFEDSRGWIWIGVKPGGLFRLRPEGDHYQTDHYQTEPGNAYSLNCDAVYYIGEDTRHRLIIATFGGGLNIAETGTDGRVRFIHKGNRLKHFPKTGLRSRCVWLMKDGTMLLGTNDGLYTANLNERYEEMHFYINRRQPDKAWSLSNNYVMEILQTRGGDVFVATSGGGTERLLSRQLLSDTLRFQHYSVSQGISSDMNQTLSEDREGRVWIVSAGSVSLLDPRTGVATNYWHLLSSVGEVFTEAAPALLPDGSMALGTTQGVLMLGKEQMTKSGYVPRIVFDCEREVNLTAEERDFSIRFAALDYNKTEEIVYAYKMEGIDSEWRYTRAHELNYVQLAPGTYVLHVKSTNGDGVWVDNEETVVLHRAAHFNETPYAWMLYGLLLAVVIAAVGATVYYIRKLKRELQGLEVSSREQIEALGLQLKEMLPGNDSVKEIHEEADSQLSSEDRLFAQKLKEFVWNNIDNADLTVIDLARAMNVSRTVLFVRMRHIFDSSPNNYILNTRINYARQLLKESDVRVSEVAFKSGFSDPKYFSRCFKKLVGMLPKEYAESLKSSERRG